MKSLMTLLLLPTAAPLSKPRRSCGIGIDVLSFVLVFSVADERDVVSSISKLDTYLLNTIILSSSCGLMNLPEWNTISRRFVSGKLSRTATSQVYSCHPQASYKYPPAKSNRESALKYIPAYNGMLSQSHRKSGNAHQNYSVGSERYRRRRIACRDTAPRA